jgi:hypothetical protein
MKKFLFFGFLCIPVLLLSGQIPLKDCPVKGEWNFQPENIWEIQRAGNEEFGQIGELLVSDRGLITFRDFGRNISYLVDEGGDLVKKFAPQGKEAGQLSRYLNRFQAGDKIVLAAPDKLHFFSPDGVFERAVENNLFFRFPLYFIDENEFIYAPNLPRSPVHEKKLMLLDLASGQERLFTDFSEANTQGGELSGGPMLMIPSLTPQVRLAYHRGKMAFGRSDQYKIYVADQAGKILSFFSLDRKRKTASLDDKRLLLADIKIPEEQKTKIIAQLPGEMTYFSRLDIIDGFIYVFAVTDPGPKANSQQIDIFSEKGEYLYRGQMKFNDHLKFTGHANLVIKGGFAYVILENDQGRRTLAKYRIMLPK